MDETGSRPPTDAQPTDEGQVRHVSGTMQCEIRLDAQETEVAAGALGAEPAHGSGASVSSAEAAQHATRRGVIAGTRFMAIVPSVGLLVAAVTLTIRTLANVATTTHDVMGGRIDMQAMLVEYIECADFFLLSIVMYIMAVGLYSLFIDPDVQMPAWLEIRSLDDLKEKLVGVIVVVMGVYFLGQLIHGSNTLELMYMGVAIGAVVASLTYFVRHVISGGRR